MSGKTFRRMTSRLTRRSTRAGRSTTLPYTIRARGEPDRSPLFPLRSHCTLRAVWASEQNVGTEPMYCREARLQTVAAVRLLEASTIKKLTLSLLHMSAAFMRLAS